MVLFKIDEQLSLKLLEIKDAQRIFELIDKSREYLREWLSWLDMTMTSADTRLFIHAAKLDAAAGKSLNTAVVFNDEIVGMAGFNSIDQTNKTAKIGYWLAPDYQGLGIVTKVTKALTDYAFYDLGLNKVEIRVATENTKSRAIPERLGYIEETTLPQAEWLYDHYVDHVVYAMHVERWKHT